MVDEVITKQELIDAQKDAQSLDDFINGDDEQIVVTRLLKEYPTLANAVRQIYEKGGKFYPTLAAANADIANIRTDVYVITGDNGAYYKATSGATTLTKSPYDPLEQAKSYTDTAKSSAISTAASDATTKANTAEANAKAYTDNEVGIVQAAVDAIPLNEQMNASKTELSNFFGDYQNGILIDATQESGVEVLSVENGVKSYDSIDNFFAGAFLSPKIVVGKSGNWEFSKHNIFIKTDDLTSNGWARTGLGVEKGQRSIKGDLSANLLTTTATTANIKQNTASAGNNRDVCASVIIKPVVNVTHAYLMLAVGVNVVFDLVAKTVVSLGSASTANIQDLGGGYFKLSAVFNVVTASVGVGLSDNASITATKTGLSAIVEQLQLNFGGVAQDYTENTGIVLKSLAAFDYSRGKRTLLIEPQRTYRGTYSEDFTQSAWVKTGLTASLTAKSIVNTLCSRLTATAPDATALQTITQTVLRFSVFIKRVAGSGSVYVTVDDGATWQDITSKLSTTEYSRIIIDGSGKTYGLKLAVSGDAVDVCLANPHDRFNTLSPAPSYASASYLAIDNIPSISISNEVTTYCKAHAADFTGQLNVFQPVRLTADDGSVFTLQSSSTSTIASQLLLGGGLTYQKSHNKVADLRTFEMTLLASYAKNRYEVDVNTDYPYSFARTVSPQFSGLKIGQNLYGPFYLEKLLVVKEAIEEYDISAWRRTQNFNTPKLVNICTVTKDAQFAGTTQMREPVIHVLSDDGEKADLLILHMNKLEDGYHAEAPARLMQRKVRYYKKTNEFVYLTPTEVSYEQAKWIEGKGHTQSPAVAKLVNGVNSGRIVMVFAQADSDDLTTRNIYCRYSDDNASVESWTTPVKILDSQTVFGTGTTIGCPDGSLILLPSDHPIAPNRLIFPVYNVGWFATLYSDDGGQTWLHSEKITVIANQNEPTLCTLPNGDLLISLRVEASGQRFNCKSSDGGVTWTPLGLMINFDGANVSGSLVQLDKTGLNKVTNPNGSPYLVISGNTEIAGRVGLAVNKISQDLVTIVDRFYPLNKVLYVGYSSTSPIFNNEYLAIAFEGGRNSSAFNENNSSYLAIVKV